MKVKTKKTTEVEVEISLPAFYKRNDCELYFSIYSQADIEGLFVGPDVIRFLPTHILLDDIDGYSPCSEAEFNAFTEKTLHKIQSLFYQTEKK